MKCNENDKPYVELAGAILKQAQEELFYALLFEDHEAVERLEKWFRGEWAQALSFHQGEAIISMTEREATSGKLTTKTIGILIRAKIGGKNYGKEQIIRDCKKAGLVLKHRMDDGGHIVSSLTVPEYKILLDYVIEHNIKENTNPVDIGQK